MRRSLRSNVVTWLISNASCSRKLSEFGVRPSPAVKPTAFLSCDVRLSMPFARISDSVTRKTLKLFRKPRRSSLRYLRFLLLVLSWQNQKEKLLQKAAKATKILQRSGLQIPSLSSLPPVGSCLSKPKKRLLQKTAKATKIGLRIQNAFAIFVSFCLRLFLYQRRCCISDRQA